MPPMTSSRPGARVTSTGAAAAGEEIAAAGDPRVRGRLLVDRAVIAPRGGRRAARAARRPSPRATCRTRSCRRRSPGPARYLSRCGWRSGGWNAMKKWNAPHVALPSWCGAWCSTITYGNDIRHRLSKRMVTADSAPASDVDLGVVSANTCAHAPLGDDVDLVGVAGEVGHERDHVVVLVQHAAAVLLLGADDVRHQPAPGVALVALRRAELGLDRLPDERRRVDLAVRVRVGDADDVALVLEAQHLANLRARAQLARLARARRRRPRRSPPAASRPASDRGAARSRRRARRRRRASRGRAAAATATSRGASAPDARVIVVEHERAVVARVDARRRRARCPGRGSSRDRRPGSVGGGRGHRLARPRPVLAVRRHDHPLLAQRMPALFPAPGLRRSSSSLRARPLLPPAPRVLDDGFDVGIARLPAQDLGRLAARRRPAPADRRRAGRSRAPGPSCRLTFSTAAITSRTECPRPVPRLTSRLLGAVAQLGQRRDVRVGQIRRRGCSRGSRCRRASGSRCRRSRARRARPAPPRSPAG